MSDKARQRAAMRRARRQTPSNQPAQKRTVDDQPARDWGAGHADEEPQPRSVSPERAEEQLAGEEHEPAQPTTSGGRRNLTIPFRPRDMEFLEAMAQVEDQPIEKIVERVVREAARKYRPSRGDTMRWSEWTGE